MVTFKAARLSKPIKVLAAFCVALHLFLFLRTLILGEDIVQSLIRLAPSAVVLFISALAGLAVFHALNPKKPLYVILAVVLISIPLAFVSAIVGNAMVFTIDNLYAGDCTTPYCLHLTTPPLLAEAVTGNIFIYASLFLIQLWIQSVDEARDLELRAAAARATAREAELRALRYQVNPHFLFNCLNSLATLVDRGDKNAAARMIREMSAFLRYSLAADAVADVELEDEIEMQRRYLEIERQRFSHRLTLQVVIAEEVRHARVPSLILQPLVENAIKHGVASTSAPVTVAIKASRDEAGRLALHVEDDAPSDGLPARGMGIGLRNVADRLAARFGGAAELDARRIGSGGFRAALTLPLERL